MEDRTLTLIKWMNKTFTNLQQNNLQSITDLKDPFCVEQILIEIDEKFFSGMNLISNESSQTYNLNCVYKQIAKFYKEIIGIIFEEDFFNPKSNSQDNYRKLAELITGISAQSEKRGYYLQIMQNMENEDSTELFTILTERISAYTEDMIMDTRKNDESEEDEQTALYLRIENLELENAKLQEDMKVLNVKVADLTKENYMLELNAKDIENKYQEILHSLENKNSDFYSKHDMEDSVSLSIQLSEMKGKLEAKEKNIQKLKEEKEKIIDEYKTKLHSLNKENEILREKSIKYDVLKEKMHSLDEIVNLKAKLVQSERIIKEQEEKIKKLKNFDVDKSILLKKIEEINYEWSQDKEKASEILKENNYYKEVIIQNDSDLKFLRKQLDQLRETHSDLSNIQLEKGSISLSELEDDANYKKYVLDLETKLKFFQGDKDSFHKEKSELESTIQDLNQKLEEKGKDLEKYMKKESKYSKYKEEKHTFVTKISDLMEKMHELRSLSESQRFSHTKEMSDMELAHKNEMSNTNQKHNEEMYSIKEILNRVENENNYLKRDIKKNEELNDSNKLYIEELQKKIQNPNISSEISIDIENKIKEFNTLEKMEIKRKLEDREIEIAKLNEKVKTYETKVKDDAYQLEKMKKQNEEKCEEEIKKREETINYYKQQLDFKEKMFNDELQFVASLFYKVALDSNHSRNPGEGNLNFNVDKL